MNNFPGKLIIVVLALGSLHVSAGSPNIGYLYPAGGKQGSVVKVIAGGQFLNNPTKVIVSGKGVRAKVLKRFRTRNFLYREEREFLIDRMIEVRNKRLKEQGLPVPKGKPRKKRDKEYLQQQKNAAKSGKKNQKSTDKKKNQFDYERWRMPDHPLTLDFDRKTLRELAHVRANFFTWKWRKQRNRQLSELLLLEITIEPDAKPGSRELCIATPNGLTRPVIFKVGTLPEVVELEPNDRQAYPPLRGLKKQPKKEPPLTLPVILNGQIMPGDVDRFRFKAKKGRQLVIALQARSLIPYLADAVPGWFQAVVAIYDAKGKEIAFADDYRFNPDPVMLFKVPHDGEYELEVRDSIYRGRADFVYRITVGELPFITSIFPLGGRVGKPTVANIDGWNLPRKRLKLDTSSGGGQIRRTALQAGPQVSNSVLYSVSDLPENNETEPNNTLKQAGQITLPVMINGRIGRPGDVDVYQFRGQAGDKVVAEVFGRRLNSPLDSLLRLTDANGKVLKWNDDFVRKDKYLYKDASGLITHHADSYLTVKLPKNGVYYLSLSDTAGHGGKEYGYRLRISPPRPDFILRVTPSNMKFKALRMLKPIRVYALRQDGFNGAIDIVLKKPSHGYKLAGGRIPAGRDCAHMILESASEIQTAPATLRFEGRAKINGQTVVRQAVPANDVMQAFLYRHLVPTGQFLAVVNRTKWKMPLVELQDSLPVEIPVGGNAGISVTAEYSDSDIEHIRLKLKDPPKGICLEKVKKEHKGFYITVKADKTVLSGLEQYLIIEMEQQYIPKKQPGKPLRKPSWYSRGFFPAIPIKTVKKP